jgi:hypothetical protein
MCLAFQFQAVFYRKSAKNHHVKVRFITNGCDFTTYGFQKTEDAKVSPFFNILAQFLQSLFSSRKTEIQNLTIPITKLQTESFTQLCYCFLC